MPFEKARSRTTESEKVWQQIADNLNSDHTLKFPSKKFVFFFLRETGVIAGSTNFSSNKRSLRYQSSKTSRVFLKDVMELKHERITLSPLVSRALHPTCSILICFSREGGGVLAPGFLRSLYRRVQGILRSLMQGVTGRTSIESLFYSVMSCSASVGNYFCFSFIK